MSRPVPSATATAAAAVLPAGFADRLPALRLPAAPPTRVRSHVLAMGVAALGLFGGLGSWAALAPMTSAVVASGSFRVEGERLAIQHLDGGTLRAIEVSEGDLVAEGQVLATLDDRMLRTQAALLEGQLAAALAEEARLRAEQLGRDRLEVPAELRALIASDPSRAPLLQAERDVLATTLRTLAGQEAILRERIGQFDERRAGIEARRASLESELALVQDELVDLDTLRSQGLVPAARVTDRRRDEAEILGNLGSLEADLLNVGQQVAEIEERILQVRRDASVQTAADRQAVQATILDLRERLAAVEAVIGQTVIRAPRAGRVVNLAVNTIGGVVAPGARILEIVPSDAAVVVEARVRPSDIDEVTAGGVARVRLSAYSARTTPPVEGRVSQVSADSLTDPATGQAYYRVDVVLPPEALAALPHVRALPGMPADVMIETGEQTLLDYLLDPVLVGLDGALAES